jgi:hypothetical protein
VKFDSEDNGNCRVYYRDGRSLYCYQDDGSWGRHDWKFYSCTYDGEPSYEVAPRDIPPCPGETSVGRDLNEFLKSGKTPDRDRANDEAGMKWWNNLSDQERRHWMHEAGDTGRAVDAWNAYQKAQSQ